MCCTRHRAVHRFGRGRLPGFSSFAPNVGLLPSHYESGVQRVSYCLAGLEDISAILA